MTVVLGAWLPAGMNASSVVQVFSQATSNPFAPTSDNDQVAGPDGGSAIASVSSVTGGTVVSAAPPFTPLGVQVVSGSASARATEGILGATATAGALTAQLEQNAGIGVATASASWSDVLTIDAAGLNGQTGTITAVITLSGTASAAVGNMSAQDFPEADAYVTVLGTGMSAVNPSLIPNELAAICGGWAYCSRQTAGSTSFSGSSQTSPVLIVTIPITFGSGEVIGYTLSASARGRASTFLGGGGTSGAGDASFGSTLIWGGITGVFDASGNPVTVFAAASRSGFDYTRAAVPEPHVAALLATVGLGLALRRRTRSGTRG